MLKQSLNALRIAFLVALLARYTGLVSYFARSKLGLGIHATALFLYRFRQMTRYDFNKHSVPTLAPTHGIPFLFFSGNTLAPLVTGLLCIGRVTSGVSSPYRT